ncbi:helix-turn-helix domain-containing protein [Mesobacillus maritimus]|uniref:Helix-turn-helix domain-containing protein n=1 Tax=Mesobacillus maritimus TaxID=1643336 RepID=A0ABS7K8U3_9BACI|nr:helix-turn-helix domain-containing protein [Mesobacillus maritimus]MBY0098689.1 helix-turn-helix domain-containing protein [Mesobacillus maritimus]
MSKMEQPTDTIHKIFDVQDDAVLHAEDIAKLVNMHTESVRRWCRTGKLPSYNFAGKYIVVGSDFKEFMRKAKIKRRWEQMLNE